MTLSSDEIARLNALPKFPSARGILEPTLIRHIDAVSGAWLMSNKGAWPTTTIRDSAATIEEILSRWNVVITGTGRDDVSEYLEVSPRPRAPIEPDRPIRSRAALIAKLKNLGEKVIETSSVDNCALGLDYVRGIAVGLARAMYEIRNWQEDR